MRWLSLHIELRLRENLKIARKKKLKDEQKKEKYVRMKMIKNERWTMDVFQKMTSVIGISPEDLKKPMIVGDDPSDLNLLYPYSKVTCLILYLYSMELGNPQLYAEVNRIARDMDLNYLKELGPYMRALAIVSLRVENFKKEGDIIETGKMIN